MIAVMSGDGAKVLEFWFGAAQLRTYAADIDGLARAIDGDIVELDMLIGAWLDRILHHPEFLRFEGRWRGLHWLAAQVEPKEQYLLRLLSASWSEIASDLDLKLGPNFPSHERDDISSTELYRKICQTEFNTAGGRPFGLIVVDKEVSHLPSEDGPADDTTVLASMAAIGKAAFSPFVLAASPELLLDNSMAGRRGFGPLSAVDDPASVFGLPKYDQWRGLRDKPESRFLAIVLPRVLARPPWQDDPLRAESFRYEEHAPSVGDRVWMTACYPFAAVVLRAVRRYGWPADIRGVDTGRVGGGLVTGLPDEPFLLSPTFDLPRPSIDVVLCERQERRIDGAPEAGLISVGLIPLMALPFGQEPAFTGCRSLNRPEHVGQNGDDALANSRVAGQINAVLCASRFAHTIKVKGRDMIGRLRRAEDIERELRSWLLPYVNGSTSANAELRARHPLVKANVEVSEQADRPGFFKCKLHLQPYFQLDALASTFDYETEFGSAAPGSAPQPDGVGNSGIAA